MKGYYGEAISHYRRIKGVKQGILAESLGMSRQNLSEIEQNKRMIEEEKLIISAKEFKVAPEELKNYQPEEVMTKKPDDPQVGETLIQVPEAVWKTLKDSLETNRELLRLQGEMLRLNSEALKSCADALQQAQQQMALLRHAT